MGRMRPMTSTGAPMPVIRETVRKKQPIGTPALPMAEMTETRTQRSMDPMPRVIPPFCITKSELTRMKAAQPFMTLGEQGHRRDGEELEKPRIDRRDELTDGIDGFQGTKHLNGITCSYDATNIKKNAKDVARKHLMHHPQQTFHPFRLRGAIFAARPHCTL